MTIQGTPGPDRLVGTSGADVLTGLGGADRLDGLAGADFLDGGDGRDTVVGGPGDDRIAAEEDGAKDSISCGAGRDTVTAELADQVAADCETVGRQLSRDPFEGYDGQHETEVEPDSFAWGSTIVTVFQVGRSSNAGAVVNGFATSRDAGKSWRAGLLPSFTFASTPSGPFQGASDPTVGYDARHNVWLATSIGFSLGAGTAVAVSRSRDGFVWTTPVTAVPAGPESPDKEWIACDNWSTSPLRGTCYLAYYDLVRGVIAVRSSKDGGATWSSAVPTPSLGRVDAIVNGAQPVVRKDGTLVVLFSVFESTLEGVDEIAAVRSTDGGSTFGQPVRVSELDDEAVLGLRIPPFVSAEVAADGTIWAAWSDCRFRLECDQNDIVLTSSRNGVAWTRPVHVPTVDATAPIASVLPGLGVDPASSGTHTASASSTTRCRRRAVAAWSSAAESTSSSSAPRMPAAPGRSRCA